MGRTGWGRVGPGAILPSRGNFYRCKLRKAAAPQVPLLPAARRQARHQLEADAAAPIGLREYRARFEEVLCLRPALPRPPACLPQDKIHPGLPPRRSFQQAGGRKTGEQVDVAVRVWVDDGVRAFLGCVGTSAPAAADCLYYLQINLREARLPWKVENAVGCCIFIPRNPNKVVLPT
jgi:hypothetical protein